MMTRRAIQAALAMLSLTGCVLLMGAAGPEESPPAPASKTTFYRDVLPILQEHCQSCHRPGEVGPMSLLTYREARSWAPMIRMAVLTRKMPPWYASPQYGHFANDRMLTPEQVRTLVTWVAGGTQEGERNDAPPPKSFVSGWQIGVPDRVIEMPVAFKVPAKGTIDYQYIVIPGGFTHDTWVRSAEIRAGNRAVLHHAIAFIRPPDSHWLDEVKPGEFWVPKNEMHESAKVKNERRHGGELLVFYTPGMQPMELHDEAKLIKAGSDIVLQLHYTAKGFSVSDTTRIGLIYAKEAPRLTDVTLAASNGSLKIPPYDGNYEVKAQVQLKDTVTLSSLMPHMHFRGKDFLYQAIYPDGKTETLLSVPHYDPNWQLQYRLAQPLLLPKGTRILCTAHYDNSINNPYNPDPSKEVKWGDQMWEEMMTGFFEVSVDPKVDAATLMIHEQPGTSTPPGESVRQAAVRTAASSGGAPESAPRTP